MIRVLALLLLVACSASSPSMDTMSAILPPSSGSITHLSPPSPCSGGALPVWGEPTMAPTTWLVLPWSVPTAVDRAGVFVAVRPLLEPVDVSAFMPGCWLLVHPDFVVAANDPQQDPGFPAMWHDVSQHRGEVWWSDVKAPVASLFAFHLQLVVQDAAGLRVGDARVVRFTSE